MRRFSILIAVLAVVAVSGCTDPGAPQGGGLEPNWAVGLDYQVSGEESSDGNLALSVRNTGRKSFRLDFLHVEDGEDEPVQCSFSASAVEVNQTGSCVTDRAFPDRGESLEIRVRFREDVMEKTLVCEPSAKNSSVC